MTNRKKDKTNTTTKSYSKPNSNGKVIPHGFSLTYGDKS